MAFTATKLGETVAGNERITYGTFVNDGGSTGGDINTGLNKVTFIELVAAGGSIVADAPTVNETLVANGIDGSAVTIICTANSSGLWRAYGW